MKRIFLLLLTGIFFAFSVEATEYYQIGKSLRSLAMGNTGITSANDSSAMFYNPAALANVRTWWWDMLYFHGEYSEAAEDLFTQIKNDGGLKLETAEERQTFFDDNVGKNSYIRVSSGSAPIINIENRGWTIGYNYMFDLIVNLKTRNRVSPVINYYQRTDIIQQSGISIPIGYGQWIVGVGYKKIERTLIDTDYGLTELLNEEAFPPEGEEKKGSGSGIDLGMMYRFANKARITAGLVLQNVSGFYDGNFEGILLGDAGEEKPELSAGISMSPEYGIFRATLALDIRDIGFSKYSDYSGWGRRVHVGAEVGIFPISKTYSLLAVRAGYSQGYPSLGAEVNLGHAFVLGYTQYSEEIGEYAGQLEDKRKVIYISIGF